jgi:hypothetical protein
MNLFIRQGSDVVELYSVLHVGRVMAVNDGLTGCSYSLDRKAAADMLLITTDARTKQYGQ